MSSLSRRGKIRLISYNIALILALALFSALKSYEAGYFKLQQEHQYSQSLNELSEYMGNIEVSLGKTIFVNTEPMMASMSSSILREAAGAKDALSRLPTNSLNLENIYRFLSQAGSYSISLSKKVSGGEKITEEEHNNIIELYNYAKEISDYIDGTLMNTDVEALALEQLSTRSLSDSDTAEPVLSGFEEFGRVDRLAAFAHIRRAVFDQHRPGRAKAHRGTRGNYIQAGAENGGRVLRRA